MLPSLQKLLTFLKGFESLHPNPVYAINFLYHTLHSLLKKDKFMAIYKFTSQILEGNFERTFRAF